MIAEEFKRCVKDDIKSYLDEKKLLLADEYSPTHKSKSGSHDRLCPPKKSDGKPCSAQATQVQDRC